MPPLIKITFLKENIFRRLSAGHVLSQFPKNSLNCSAIKRKAIKIRLGKELRTLLSSEHGTTGGLKTRPGCFDVHKTDGQSDYFRLG